MRKVNRHCHIAGVATTTSLVNLFQKLRFQKCYYNCLYLLITIRMRNLQIVKYNIGVRV